MVQDLFLAAWRAFKSYDRSRGSTRTWILSMVHNRAIDVLRRQHRHPVEPLGQDPQWPDRCDVVGQAVVHADGIQVRQAIAGLPWQQQATLRLAYGRGLTHVEIAARMDVPLGTVKGRIRLALGRLRADLGPHQPELAGLHTTGLPGSVR